MIVQGIITRIITREELGDTCRFSRYVIIQNTTQRSFYGLQVRKKQDRDFGSDLIIGRKITAGVHCEHSAHVSPTQDKIYLHNNIIFDKLIDIEP